VNPLLQLRDAGQSVWLDFIERRLLTSGALARMIEEDGLGGLTSNPTIFEKAIAGSADYDEQLRAVLLATPALDAQSLFEAVALDDIRQAADLLRPVFDRTGGQDGFVSFEVPASVATSTAGTVSEARRLWQAIDRPNAMIKVPATPEGIPAIEQLIAAGVNVNITLMFSLEHYEQVAQAYIRGLQRCAHPERVASVASFFVSRVDTVVDKALERLGTPQALSLRGRIAIANSKVVYARFREIFDGPAFAGLRAKGCRVQRPLWASTSSKNPAYRDVVYVEELVGRDTVNTLPPATVAAFRDHGVVRPGAVEAEAAVASKELQQLQALGIDLGRITRDLQVEGVASFAKSYDDLVVALEATRAKGGRAGAGQALELGSLQGRVNGRLETWARERTCGRIWSKDHTVWSPTPVPELTDRLGWLAAGAMRDQVGALTAFADQVRASGIEHVVLLGMGGSSLAPEVFQATFGRRAGYPGLAVLDSTHPAAVRAVERALDLSKTLFVVSSKSGTTSETNSFFQYFWSRYGSADRGAHFIAITDPGTSLERLARDRGFRRTFNGPPDVGGRYSALTPFGLVPAALVGVDLQALLARATAMAVSAASPDGRPANPALTLGAALGELALAGRDKLTFFVGEPFGSLPAWLEQLIAESTGKHDKGIIPVADEPLLAAGRYGADRVFVSIGAGGSRSPRPAADAARSRQEALLQELAAAGHPVIRITLTGPIDLGAEFFRWEFAVAASGAVLGIQPFDQPDVQLAKELARRAMSAAPGTGQATHGSPLVSRPDEWPAALDAWVRGTKAGDYIGLQAYLAPSPGATRALQALRRTLAERTGLATTLGFGPRFLHSTGQLHKGGPNSGVFLQVVDAVAPDLEVPESTYTFGQLIRAQAEGDALALAQRGRRLLRIDLGAQAEEGLATLAAAL
jgi:transaldolase / glucose-6-phosphate isomerase